MAEPHKIDVEPKGPPIFSLESQGVTQQVIDTGGEGFPESVIDLCLMHGLEMLLGAHLPPGSMIVLVDPAQAAQLRATLKKMPRAPSLSGFKPVSVPLVRSRGPGG